jgi:hypothetical protein
VLKYSGTGPDKAGLNQFFKILCKLNKVVDGDEIEVIDLMNPTGQPFSVRLEGIVAPGFNVVQGFTGTITQSGRLEQEPTRIINTNTPGGQAAAFIADKLADKPFIIRVSPNDMSSASLYTEDDLSPGSRVNSPNNYLKGKYYGPNDREKALGTIFYRMQEEDKFNIIISIRDFFIRKEGLDISRLKQDFAESLYDESIFSKKFNEIYNQISSSNMENHFIISGNSDPLASLDDSRIALFNNLVNFRILETLYSKASEWPYVSWDEYYNDGQAATLNWELVTNNLAQVYTVDLLRSRDAEISLDDQIPRLSYVETE